MSDVEKPPRRGGPANRRPIVTNELFGTEIKMTDREALALEGMKRGLSRKNITELFVETQDENVSDKIVSNRAEAAMKGLEGTLRKDYMYYKPITKGHTAIGYTLGNGSTEYTPPNIVDTKTSESTSTDTTPNTTPSHELKKKVPNPDASSSEAERLAKLSTYLEISVIPSDRALVQFVLNLKPNESCSSQELMDALKKGNQGRTNRPQIGGILDVLAENYGIRMKPIKNPDGSISFERVFI